MLNPWTTDENSDAAYMDSVGPCNQQAANKRNWSSRLHLTDRAMRNSVFDWESPQRVCDRGETLYAAELDTPMRNALVDWESPQGVRGRQQTPSPRPRSKRSRAGSLPPSPTPKKYDHQKRSSSSPPSQHRASEESSQHCAREVPSPDRAIGTPSLDPAIETHSAHCTKVRPVPIGIFWDAENCKVPSGLVSDIAMNIKNALNTIPDIDSTAAVIKSYGRLAGSTVQGLQSTGVIHFGSENKKKNCADKLIWADLLEFTYDHPAPSCVLLITGDADFAPVVRLLERRGYTVLIALPAEGTSASALFGAGSYMFDWPSLARGKGFVTRLPIPIDLDALKAEMTQLYQSKHGHIDMGDVHAEYTKMFGKQLTLADYNAAKMIDLFGQMGDPFSIVKRKIVFTTPSTSVTPPKIQPLASVMEDSSIAVEGDPNASEEDVLFEALTRDATPPSVRRNRWDETPNPVRMADADATPATTPAGVMPTPGKKQGSRWDVKPANMGSATPGGLDATAPAGYTPGPTPFGAEKCVLLQGDNSSESGDDQS